MRRRIKKSDGDIPDFLKTQPIRQQQRTAVGKQKFLAAYIKAGKKSVACRACKIDPNTEWEWESSDPDFKAAVVAALEESVEAIEVALRRQAVLGGIEAIKFFLKAHKREVYGDSQKIEIVPDEAMVNIIVEMVKEVMTPEQYDNFRTRLQAVVGESSTTKTA